VTTKSKECPSFLTTYFGEHKSASSPALGILPAGLATATTGSLKRAGMVTTAGALISYVC
jgi:hypothetical protein